MKRQAERERDRDRETQTETERERCVQASWRSVDAAAAAAAAATAPATPLSANAPRAHVCRQRRHQPRQLRPRARQVLTLCLLGCRLLAFRRLLVSRRLLDCRTAAGRPAREQLRQQRQQPWSLTHLPQAALLLRVQFGCVRGRV